LKLCLKLSLQLLLNLLLQERLLLGTLLVVASVWLFDGNRFGGIFSRSLVTGRCGRGSRFLQFHWNCCAIFIGGGNRGIHDGMLELSGKEQKGSRSNASVKTFFGMCLMRCRNECALDALQMELVESLSCFASSSCVAWVRGAYETGE
jgi:hypothetical protein